jgi:hypothetical protein
MVSWCSKRGCLDKVNGFLRMISMGKFATKLYYQGKGFKGSVATGILTVFMTLFLVYYFCILFWSIINRDNYSLEQK